MACPIGSTAPTGTSASGYHKLPFNCLSLLVALASCIFVSSLGTQAVLAQNAPSGTSSASDQLQEIIVTAQFREENLQQAPLAITAITGEMLRERGTSSVTDLGAAVPNVTFSQGSGIYPGAQMYIRGVGQENFIPSQDPGVGTYIDDVYYGNLFGADFDLIDVDRVEILRGPQGTLSGANSIGGSVKIYTQKPTGSGDGYFEAGYGSNQTTVLRGAYDVSLIPDTLFLRISGGLHRDNGYVTRLDFTCTNPGEAGKLPSMTNVAGDCRLGQEGGEDVSVARANLRWLAADNLEINLMADVDNVTSQPGAEVLLAVNTAAIDPVYQAYNIATYGVPLDNRFATPGKYYTFSTFQDLSKNVFVNPNGFSNNYGFTGTIDYKLPDNLALKSITSYRRGDGSSSEDADGSPLSASTSLYTFTHRQFTEELRLSGTSFGSFLNWTVGGFYYDAHDVLGGQVDSTDSLFEFGGLYFQVNDRIDSVKDAAYVNLTIHPTDQLSIIGGYRYSHSHLFYTFGRIDPDNPLDFPGIVTLFGLNALGAAPVASFNHGDWRAAVEYQWTPDLMTYVSVATGFKDGGINPTPLDVAQELPFKPETLTSYEIGLKSQWFDRRATMDLAAFTSKYKNLQLNALTVVDGLTDNIFTNAGQATISGVEAEFDARPFKGLMISASGSYLHFKYDSLGAAALVPDGPCLSCTNVLTPEYKGSFAVQYSIDLGQWGSLTPRFSDDYTAKEYAELTNNPVMEIPQRWVANARLAYALPNAKWEAVLAVTNVFDKYYYTNINPYWYSGGNTAMGLPGRPREALVSFRHTF